MMALCCNESPFPPFTQISFKVILEKNLVCNQKDASYDNREQKNEQILEAVAETE